MEDEQIDRHAWYFATQLDEFNAVEPDGWRLERWPDADVVMAYQLDGGEWRASHYYQIQELISEGEDAPRRAADEAGDGDAV